MSVTLAVKVDVDTDRGTRIGVTNLLRLFEEMGIAATFLFSLGPDNTGRAIKRIFRPGFYKKVARTNIVSTYGMVTLLNGLLWPGPHIGQRNSDILRSTRDAGHEVGIHCYDHVRWQDSLTRMTREEVFGEFDKAREEFTHIFGSPALCAGAAGWQINALSLEAYDSANLTYASDARGTHAFFPRLAGHIFGTLQIPTTLPTLDELLGRPEFPEEQLVSRYLAWLRSEQLNVLTVHAEIEGMSKLGLFRRFLQRAQNAGIRFSRMDHLAQDLLAQRNTIPVCDLLMGKVEGRSGTLALQGEVSVANIDS